MTERVEAILRRYGVPERDIGACCLELIEGGHLPQKFVVEEWGVERRIAFHDFEPHIEWGGSVGMSHNYPYTAESVWGLADGNPVYRRWRTTYRDRLSEPERVLRPGEDVVPCHWTHDHGPHLWTPLIADPDNPRVLHLGLATVQCPGKGKS